MMSSIIKGKTAITHYKTIDSFFDLKGNNVASLLSCKLETGRTHQIRVHLSENGKSNYWR
jgi:23S rRNA pseudouridine1911/1915/1917 synthase